MPLEHGSIGGNVCHTIHATGAVTMTPGSAPPDPEAQDQRWRELVSELRSRPETPFSEHWEAFRRIFTGRPPEAGPPLVWQPEPSVVGRSHIGQLMKERGIETYAELHRWSATHRAEFWRAAIEKLGIVFTKSPDEILDRGEDVRDPIWLRGAELNCADSCFRAGGRKPAILFASESAPELAVITYRELGVLVNRFARGLAARGLSDGDAVALYMPMNVPCVIAYLGVVRAGGRVVSIADSFSAEELRRRAALGGAKLLVTATGYQRGGKWVDLYVKVKAAEAPRAVVVPEGNDEDMELRRGDVLWTEFLSGEDTFSSRQGDPYRITNILFSSGTTGIPKAIPWTHLTPIKCATDGRFHQDIHAEDVVCWPTNVGWMMGPWLIYASLMNGATMALFEGAPTSAAFVDFVARAGVSILGVVPSVVRAWRQADVLPARRWEQVRLFSSTGEPSNREDYLWLMSRVDYRAPVIEYLGGTEIGGGHITGTIVQPASPATFTTPALGLDFVVLDDGGRPVSPGGSGELFIIPPSIGLSQTLLNRDHHEVYYAGCPPGPDGKVLRRHGDQIERLHGGFYRARGRADDTMNLGGIKVSSIELEQILDAHPAVYESAAIGAQPQGEGAERLVVYVVASQEMSAARLCEELSVSLGRSLNPLFKIHELIVVEKLPRTASNKLMRRELRADYESRDGGIG